MNKDIQTEILLSLPIKDILNYCTVNKTANTICSEAYFWKRVFNEHHLAFPSIKYDDPYEWALAFKKEKVINDNVDYFINILNHKILSLDAYINHAFFDILNVYPVDSKDLSTIQNSFVLRKLTDEYHPSDCIATLSRNDGNNDGNDDDKFVVEIVYRPHRVEYIYEISKESMEQILYNSISRGAELLTINGFQMRFKK